MVVYVFVLMITCLQVILYFKGSIGRTDFEGGSFEQIINSIKTKLLTMSDGIHVYPGHGPASTIGTERRTNSYIR